MDRTPVEAPYGRASVENVSAALRQELSCVRKNLSAKACLGKSVLTLHSFCVWRVKSLMLVCAPNGPKSQNTGGAAEGSAAL